MAATYQQIFDAVQNTPAMRNRSFVAVSKSASYLAGGGGSPSPERLAWAKDALLNVEREADRIRWLVGGILALDAQYPTDLAALTDAQVQSLVETALNSIIPA